jgi:hypothetical protein
MIDVNKVHPLFDKILADHFHTQAPLERIYPIVKPQARPMSNEDYLEYHEGRDELQMSYNEGYGRGRF